MESNYSHQETEKRSRRKVVCVFFLETTKAYEEERVKGDTSNRGHLLRGPLRGHGGHVPGCRWGALCLDFPQPSFAQAGVPTEASLTRPLRLGSCDSLGRHGAPGATERSVQVAGHSITRCGRAQTTSWALGPPGQSAQEFRGCRCLIDLPVTDAGTPGCH